MRFIVQRVSNGSVSVKGDEIGEISRGLVVLIGVSHDDTVEVCEKMVKKLLKLRIFDDEDGKSNLSLETVKGDLLLISQFTLYADCKKGNRPSFVKAAGAKLANEMYEKVIQLAKEKSESVGRIETGIFGADMLVRIDNSGPFTIVMDSEEL